jgi:hypothetical protein
MKQRRSNLTAFAYFVVGVVVVTAAIAHTDGQMDRPAWLLVALFAGTCAALSFRSVEFNDRLLASASVMVVFSAGVFFALRQMPSGAFVGAVLPMTVVAAAGFLSVGDLTGRIVFRPLINFGQLGASGFVAGAVIDLILSSRVSASIAGAVVGIVPSWRSADAALGLTVPGSMLVVVMAAVPAAAAYSVTNIVLVRLAARIIYGSASLQPWSRVPYLASVEVVQASIGSLLGAVLAFAPSLSFLPLILVMFVTGQMVFTSYAKLRIAHEDTLRGFVKTLEARDLYTRGHTERVAEFVRMIGEELGFSGTNLERMRWAALIHDVGKLAVPSEVMRKQGSLDDDEYREFRRATHRVDDLLSEVDFLGPMVSICSGVHPRLSEEDFGQRHHDHAEVATREQSVLAVADAFDAMTSTRSYRMAMTQEMAIASLHRSGSQLFHPVAVAALASALAKQSGTYGPPDLDRVLDGGSVRA